MAYRRIEKYLSFNYYKYSTSMCMAMFTVYVWLKFKIGAQKQLYPHYVYRTLSFKAILELRF